MNGAGYAYMQHLTSFNKINRDIFPRQAMLDDIITDTVKWKEDGDQIIIMDDINSYL